MKLSKLGHGLERKIKAALNEMLEIIKPGLDFKWSARTGWVFMSLLITCISLAPAKGARLVAPGTVLSIYPQSRYSRMAGYQRNAKPCFSSSHPGTW